ncbi:uncharacterized protein G2W53_033749 [Senna tora]|uniref:Uncharacterized protein n=1 Tax=Senna tora TaxID=362788 RepID=A0A834SZU8_9FABA|nr:uncharacterized protein G2W53_033749 [Senna tora]
MTWRRIIAFSTFTLIVVTTISFSKNIIKKSLHLFAPFVEDKENSMMGDDTGFDNLLEMKVDMVEVGDIMVDSLDYFEKIHQYHKYYQNVNN